MKAILYLNQTIKYYVILKSRLLAGCLADNKKQFQESVMSIVTVASHNESERYHHCRTISLFDITIAIKREIPEIPFTQELLNI